MVAAANQLQGGTTGVAPFEVAFWYSMLAAVDGIYSHPTHSADGYAVTTGGQARSVFGVPVRVSFRADVLSNLHHPAAAQVLGHEGAHLVDANKGLGLTHEQIYAIPWWYQR